MVAPVRGEVVENRSSHGVPAVTRQTHGGAQLLQRRDAVAVTRRACASGRARPVLAAVLLAAGGR